MILRYSSVLLMFCFYTVCAFAQGTVVEYKQQEPIVNVKVKSSDIYYSATQQKSSNAYLPLETIGYTSFYIEEDVMISDDFASKMPELKTYRISATENPALKGRMLLTPTSTWITILTPNGLVSLYPKDGAHVLEMGIHYEREHGASCTNFASEGQNSDWIKMLNNMSTERIDFSNGTVHRTYDFAIVCTGEFYELNGNSNNAVLTVIAATVNSLNVIFENELAVRLSLLTPFIGYTDSSTDIFTPDMLGGDPRTDQAGAAVNMHFDVDDYDIGHVFHQSADDTDGWSSGGIARLASVCNSTISAGGPAKAKGWSGSYNTSGNGWIALVAHEIGHMFGATHTFNGSGESCDDAIEESSAYEIGSGTTIMSYQGICDEAQNIEGGSAADNYFHVHNLAQMIAFINNTATCSDNVPLNNTPPVVNPNQCNVEINIPHTTAFYLKGNAGDQENTNITYTWEQYDEDGATTTPTQGFIGTAAGNSPIAPLFRSFPPSPNPDRYFPTLPTIIDGIASDPFQAVPRRERTLHFQLTARDNNAMGGGVASEEVEVNVSSNGPLNIANIGPVTAGTPFNVTWNTNGTDALCNEVEFRLSVDGGNSFPFIVAEGIDYSSGSAMISLVETFPQTMEARLMIACADFECFTFFDVTDGSFPVESNCMATTNIVCDSEFETFDQGDAALNLDLSHFTGDIVKELTETITPDVTTRLPICIRNEGGLGCLNLFTYFSESSTLVVDKTGTYTFSIDVGANGGTGIVSIYTANNYDDMSPCNSFISSNTTSVGGTSFSLSTSMTVSLDACEEYLLISTNNTGLADLPIDTEITGISGPGIIIKEATSEPANYSNTFIAVNETGIIEIESSVSDFTNAAGGLYDIYNVMYKSSGPEPPANVDPGSWVGQSIADIQSTDCILLSANKKQIEVEFSCRILDIVASAQTTCDPINNTYSQELIITYEMAPTTGSLIVNGTPFMISGSPQTVTLFGQLSDGMPKGVNAAFSEVPGCSKFIPEVYTAPENCCDIDFDLGGDRVVCDGEPIILDGGDDGDEYMWFLDGVDLMVSSSTLEVTESGNYLLDVRKEMCIKSQVVNITVNPSPTADLGEDLSPCEGDIFIINSNTNAPDIKWYKDGTELMGETDANLLITESGQYVVEGTSTNDCVVTDTVDITYVTKPIVELGEPQEFCEGDMPFVLDAGGDGVEYTWSRNNVTIPGEVGQTLEVSQTGLYSVIVSKGGGCESTDNVEITFYELGEVFAGEDRNVCEGNTTNLLPFINADSYEWYFMGSLYSDQSESPEVSEGGEYVLVGKNSFGCEISDTVLVTVVMPPMIDLGDDKIGCIGSGIPLSIDSVGNVLWAFNGSILSTNASIVATESGEYVANIIAASGCTDRDTILIDFQPGPSVEVGENVDICEGETYIIEAMTEGDNIRWLKDGEEITGETDFMLEVGETGMYTAVVSGMTDCEAEDFINVTVNPRPVLELGDDKVICDGESIPIESGIEGVNYSWTYDGTFISDEENIVAIEAGEYVLVVTDANNCTTEDMIAVNANAIPTLMLDEVYNICDNESATITADSDGDTFTWFVDGEELMGETSNTITVSMDADIEVIASSADGCTNTEMTTVVSAASPTVDLGMDFTICPGTTQAINAGTHASYQWSTQEDGQEIVISSLSPEIQTTEIYMVTVTNTEGCTATDEVEVTFLPIVQGEITASAAGVCNGTPVILTASGGTSYEWMDNSGTLSDINENMATASPTESTTYQVLISDDCPNNEDLVSIEINVFTAGDAISAGEDDCVISGQTYELQGSGGVSYEWQFNESFVTDTDIPNPQVSPAFETTYFVDITDSNGCVFTDSVTICVNENPLEDFKLISIITPNGDGENDALEFKGLEAFQDNILTIYNRWGYPVFEKRRYQSDSELWNGENGGEILPAGTYYYVLEFDGNVYKSTITLMR